MRASLATALGQPARNRAQQFAELVPMDERAGLAISDALGDPRTARALATAQASPRKIPVSSGGYINNTNAGGLYTMTPLNESMRDWSRLSGVEERFLKDAGRKPRIFLNTTVDTADAQRILDRLGIGEKVKDARHARAIFLAHEVGHALADMGDANLNMVRTGWGQRFDDEAVADFLGFQLNEDELGELDVDKEEFYRYLRAVTRGALKPEMLEKGDTDGY